MSSVLVTGSSGGLGSATVAAYLEAGHRVFGLDQVTASPSASFTPMVVDLADEDAMCGVMRQVGPIQHVVSIAGGALRDEKSEPDVAELSLELFRASLERNLISAFVTIKTAMPNLRAATGDRSISFTTSTDAMLSYGLPAYAAAKAGIIGLVNSLTDPLGREGIRVNAVAPGDIPTARNRSEWAHKPDWYQDLAANNPLRRLCTPQEIAETFVALSDRLTGITGQTIVVDAGLIRAQPGIAGAVDQSAHNPYVPTASGDADERR